MAAVPSRIMPIEENVKNVDVNDPKVKAVAEFALSKYPEEKLILHRVEAGQTVQAFRPEWNFYYNLIISARRCHEPLLVFCSAIVKLRVSDQSYHPISFVRLP